RQTVYVDSATVDWPKSTPAGLITKVCAVIHCPCKNALSWRLDQPHAIRRPEAVGGPGHKCLDSRDLRVAQAIQLRELDNPNATRLHGGIFASEVCQFIGEELAGKCSQRSRFSDSLGPFENETAVRLRPGRKIRATAEISHRDPTARAYSVSSAPRYVESQP